MTDKEFKRLKVGGHVAIIQTGWEAVVLNIQKNTGKVLVQYPRIGNVYPLVAEKRWYNYTELGKL